MIQDPTRLASLLSDLCKITGDRATAIVVTNDLARAATIGIDSSNSVRFYACADSFTRSIGEAHDRARKIVSKGGSNDGPVEAKPAQTETSNALNLESGAA